MPQRLDQQPGAVAAGAGRLGKGLLTALDPGLQANDIADMTLEPPIERHEKVHGAGPAAVDVGQEAGELGTCAFRFQIGPEIARQRRLSGRSRDTARRFTR